MQDSQHLSSWLPQMEQLHLCLIRCAILANEIFSTRILFHTYLQDILWKNFQDWCLPDKQNPILSFLPVEGRVCLYNCSYSSRSLPTVERIKELDFACQEDTNLENFFTEYLVYMCGTLFWYWKFHSQVWHILMLIDHRSQFCFDVLNFILISPHLTLIMSEWPTTEIDASRMSPVKLQRMIAVHLLNWQNH